MSAIRDEDMAAARDVLIGAGDYHYDCEHCANVLPRIAQAIADARTLENKMCGAIVHSSPDIGVAAERIAARRSP
jgi:hypothetical protein